MINRNFSGRDDAHGHENQPAQASRPPDSARAGDRRRSVPRVRFATSLPGCALRPFALVCNAFGVTNISLMGSILSWG